MRNKIILFLTLIMLVASTAAWAKTPLSFSETTVQFGTMTEGPVANKTVTITNPSKDVVTIENVTTNWSCTTTALGQRSLQPGESTELVINYNTFKYPGKFDKRVTVFTGKGKDDLQEIKIQGFVDPIPMGVLELDPRKVVLKNLVAGKKNLVTLLVKNTGDAPMTVSSAKSKKFKKVLWEGRMSLKPGEAKKIQYDVTPKSAGKYMDIVMIHSNARNDIGNGYKAIVVGEAK